MDKDLTKRLLHAAGVPVPVFTDAQIEDFRATAGYLVVSTMDAEGHSHLIVTDPDGQNPRELPLPGEGTVTNLQSADRGNLIGYTFTDADGRVFHADDSRGLFVADDGTTLSPGWRVLVGTENFTKVFTDSRLTGPFLSALWWTFAFSILTVLTTFALGLLLAAVFNDPRVKGRTLYRALFILPYAFPGFLAALVWRGMLNREFGYINQVLLGGVDINWLGDGNLAKLSIIFVNL